MTIEQSYTDFLQRLKNIYDEREASNIADWVFESIAGIKRLDRIMNRQRVMDDSIIKKLDDTLSQLLQHKPLQYILGEAWFYKMRFFVNESVLIPRPETEELIEWIVKEVKGKKEALKIIDVGTGSGCIAIALKRELPNKKVFAIDVSSDALTVAKQNAAALSADIEFIQTDFLNEGSWPQLSSFDVIVSNPPYIPANEKNKIKKNVVDYEPGMALFVDDNDTFIFYRKIASFASSHLNEGGKIFVEVHEEYAYEVSKVFTANNFTTIIKKDIFGRDRMIAAHH
jgi:release factor glutamine methyltransferase